MAGRIEFASDSKELLPVLMTPPLLRTIAARSSKEPGDRSHQAQKPLDHPSVMGAQLPFAKA